MKKWKAVALGVAGVALVTGAMAAAVMSGPLQALFPARHGLHEIAPNVWSDDVTSDAENLELLAYSRNKVADFYGVTMTQPRIILCSAQPCANLFFNNEGGNGPRGKTWGASLVVVAPRGLNRMIVTHELAHVELHELFKLSDNWNPRFPAWFNEGLSGWISQDDRLETPDEATMALVLSTLYFWDFRAAVDQVGWKQAYGAGMDEVARMASIGGKAELLTLIDSVGNGADFWQERARLLSLPSVEN